MVLNVIVIGLGQIGMGYDLHLDSEVYVYSHARAFSQHPSFKLVAAVDPMEETRKVFEHEYNCPAYTTIDAALLRHQPDLVIIAVPTSIHSETLHQVLRQSRPKAVLCEKPLSYDLNEARAMVQACVANGVDLYVNYMRRSDSGVIEIKRRLGAGEICAPVKGVAWYSKGFLHNGSHLFNLLEYWLGAMRTSEILSRGRLWGGSDPEPDIRVTFERGEIIFLAAWEEAFSHYTIELLSPSGRLRYEQGGKLIHWQAVQRDVHLKGYIRLAVKPDVIDSSMDRYQWHVADQLAHALNGRDAQLCSGAAALQTLENMKDVLERIGQ